MRTIFGPALRIKTIGLNGLLASFRARIVIKRPSAPTGDLSALAAEVALFLLRLLGRGWLPIDFPTARPSQYPLPSDLTLVYIHT
jgi:hypothetical protein